MTNFPMYKFLAPEFIFGPKARDHAGRYARNLGAAKVLLVTDPGLLNTGWVNDVIISFEKENIKYHVFAGVLPNPRDFQVMEGSRVYKEEKCDAIVAVGGGSVIDCAKGIGIVSTNQNDILSFEGVDKVPLPMPPLVCIPTTSGTSADVSQFAIINNTQGKVKIAIISKSVVPDIALIDPETLFTMDASLTACTGIDALVHAIEAYVSNAASSFTDMHAEEAIRKIDKYLVKSVHNLDNFEYRNEMMHASLLAGLAFSNASLGCTHSMAHSLGGYLDLSHGECNAMLLPHVVDFNFNSNPSKFENICRLVGIPVAHGSHEMSKKDLVQWLLNLKLETNIVSTLQTKGVKSSDISLLASKAIQDPCNATNPKTPTRQDLEVIYKEAM